MNLLEELKGLGVNVEEGIDRLMGNASLYERMIGRFLNMMKTMEIQPDFDSTDYDYTEVMEKAHTIKGTAGNLSITPLYEGYSEIVRLLRAGDPEAARSVLVKILPVQKGIMDCIEAHV